MKVTTETLADIFSVDSRTVSRWTREGLQYTETYLNDDEGRLRIHRVFDTVEAFVFMEERRRWTQLARQYNRKYGADHTPEFHKAYCQGAAVGIGNSTHGWRAGGQELERLSTLFEVSLEEKIRELENG